MTYKTKIFIYIVIMLAPAANSLAESRLPSEILDKVGAYYQSLESLLFDSDCLFPSDERASVFYLFDEGPQVGKVGEV